MVEIRNECHRMTNNLPILHVILFCSDIPSIYSYVHCPIDGLLNFCIGQNIENVQFLRRWFTVQMINDKTNVQKIVCAHNSSRNSKVE